MENRKKNGKVWIWLILGWVVFGNLASGIVLVLKNGNTGDGVVLEILMTLIPLVFWIFMISLIVKVFNKGFKKSLIEKGLGYLGKDANDPVVRKIIGQSPENLRGEDLKKILGNLVQIDRSAIGGDLAAGMGKSEVVKKFNIDSEEGKVRFGNEDWAKRLEVAKAVGQSKNEAMGDLMTRKSGGGRRVAVFGLVVLGIGAWFALVGVEMIGGIGGGVDVEKKIEEFGRGVGNWVGGNPDNLVILIVAGVVVSILLTILPILAVAWKKANRKRRLEMLGIRTSGEVLEVVDTGLIVNNRVKLRIKVRVNGKLVLEVVDYFDRGSFPKVGGWIGVIYDPMKVEDVILG